MEKIKCPTRRKGVLLKEEIHEQLVRMQVDLAYHEKRKMSLENVILYLLDKQQKS
tara:strand:- start:257 stop:421 length:165 start_codon:yes stop_codon:yes gene_type:complete